MKTIKTDLLVIGAGSGGLSVAAGAVQMGADVTLLEGHKMGGDCLNYGCVPSKALLAAGHAAHAMTMGAAMGVTPVAPQVDYAAAKDHVKSVIDTIAPVDSQERFEGLGVRVIREFGRFTGPRTVQAGDTQITARRVIIATGSSPFVPPIPGLDQVPYQTNETLFDLRDKPDHLLIIGGGPIGMEMAQAHIRLGCKVTVIEGMKALGKDDPELAAIALDALRDEGVEIVEGALAQQISGSEGDITVETSAGTFHGSHLLMAVGRKPNTDDLGLESAGVETDARGYIVVDDQLRTSVPHVWATGDVNGRGAFTHTSYNDYEIVAANLFDDDPRRVSDRIMAYGLYVDPPLGRVGMTENDARASGRKVLVGKMMMSRVGRARERSETQGFMKVLVDADSEEFLGAAMLGIGGDEIVHSILDIMYAGARYTTIQRAMPIHPTVSELIPTMLGDLRPLG